MEHQYPGAISGDESMLAELMLPDQAHVRNQDWTIFFLHKDNSSEEAEEQKRAKLDRKKGKQKAVEPGDEGSSVNGSIEAEQEAESDEDEDEDDSGEGPPLVYVLNLVNTKQDNTVKRYKSSLRLLVTRLTVSRGAVVKAMAICTRHSFLHIYKVRRSNFLTGRFVD